MEIVAIVFMIVASTVIGTGVVGMVQAVKHRRNEGRDTLGENIEEITELHELAERRAIIVQLIRSVRVDEEAEKISPEEARLRITGFERKAVRIAKKIDALVGDEAARDSAQESLDTYLAERSELTKNADWEWSEEAMKRHGGVRKALEADNA